MYCVNIYDNRENDSGYSVSCHLPPPRAKFVAVVLNVGDIVVPLLATTCRWFLGDQWVAH